MPFATFYDCRDALPNFWKLPWCPKFLQKVKAKLPCPLKAEVSGLCQEPCIIGSETLRLSYLQFIAMMVLGDKLYCQRCFKYELNLKNKNIRWRTLTSGHQLFFLRFSCSLQQIYFVQIPDDFTLRNPTAECCHICFSLCQIWRCFWFYSELYIMQSETGIDKTIAVSVTN